MKNFSDKKELIYNYKNIVNLFIDEDLKSINNIELILLQYLSRDIFIVDFDRNIWKYEADIFIDEKISDKIDNFEYEIRSKIMKEELLEIREILIKIKKYEIYDFLSTFIDCRKKNEKWLYFEDIITEFYEDLRLYIYNKYFKVEYGSKALIIRDIDIDINDYVYPLLWKKLSLKLFTKDLVFEDIEIQNHIIEYINNL